MVLTLLILCGCLLTCKCVDISTSLMGYSVFVERSHIKYLPVLGYDLAQHVINYSYQVVLQKPCPLVICLNFVLLSFIFEICIGLWMWFNQSIWILFSTFTVWRGGWVRALLCHFYSIKTIDWIIWIRICIFRQFLWTPYETLKQWLAATYCNKQKYQISTILCNNSAKPLHVWCV